MEPDLTYKIYVFGVDKIMNSSSYASMIMVTPGDMEETTAPPSDDMDQTTAEEDL